MKTTILLFCVFAVALGEYYSGMRVYLNNPFLNNTVSLLLPKALDMVSAMIQPPNGTSHKKNWL